MTLTDRQRRRVIAIVEQHPWGDFVRVEDFIRAMSRLHEALSPYMPADDPPPDGHGEWALDFDEFSVPPEHVDDLSETARLTYVAQLVESAFLAYNDIVVDLVHDLHAVVLDDRA